MGERRNGACRVDLERELRVEFHGVKVTSDAGLLAYRELDGVFGLTEMAGRELCDPCTGKNTQHTMTALPRPVKHWSLTTLREKMIKIGAKVVHHARYVTFQMAEVAVPRQLFRAILDRVRRLRSLPVLARAG